MLVAINHMQIDMCIFRSGQTGFRKNIIFWPQVQEDYKHFSASLTAYNVGDVVTVKERYSEESFTAEILNHSGDGFVVRVNDNEQRFIRLADIVHRVVLPWNPRALKDTLNIFRRRKRNTPEMLEDLRVRRNMIRRLLRFFTLHGYWRDHRAVEPLHQ